MGHREFQFRILNAISRDFSGDHTFPTCLDAAVSIRNALKDPFGTVATLTAAVGREPLIAARVLRLANSLAYNPGGGHVTELPSAIGRIGFETVRTLSLAVALEQLTRSALAPGLAPYASQAWERSLLNSAIARAVARRLAVCNPEEALLAGLLSQIGVFYLLYRAADEPLCHAAPEMVLALLRDWQHEVRETILIGLEIPAPIRHALAQVDTLALPEAPEWRPNSLPEVLACADRLAGPPSAWDSAPASAQSLRQDEAQRLAGLVAEARDEIQAVRQSLAG